MTSSYIERLLGHLNTEYLDGAYFRPPEADMVEAYRRAIPNLTILEDVQSEEFQKRQLLRQAALLLPQEKLRLLLEILSRERSIDAAVDEFRRLRTEQAPEVARASRSLRRDNRPDQRAGMGGLCTQNFYSSISGLARSDQGRPRKS